MEKSHLNLQKYNFFYYNKNFLSVRVIIKTVRIVVGYPFAAYLLYCPESAFCRADRHQPDSIFNIGVVRYFRIVVVRSSCHIIVIKIFPSDKNLELEVLKPPFYPMRTIVHEILVGLQFLKEP